MKITINILKAINLKDNTFFKGALKFKFTWTYLEYLCLRC